MGIFRLFKRSRRKRSGQGLSAKAKGARHGDTAAFNPVRLAALVAVVLVWGVSSFTMLYRPTRSSYSYVTKQIAPITHYAEVEFHYVDEAETTARKNRKASAILDIFGRDSAADLSSRRNIEALFAHISAAPTEEGVDPDTSPELPESIRDLSQPRIDTLKMIFDNEDKQSSYLEALSELQLKGIMAAKDRLGYKNSPPSPMISIVDSEERLQTTALDDVASPSSVVAELATRMAGKYQLAKRNFDALVELSNDVLVPLIHANLSYDDTKTSAQRQAARESVADVMKLVKQGTIFLKKDHTISKADLIKLEAHETAVKNSHHNLQYFRSLIIYLLLSGLLIIFGATVIVKTLPELCRQPHIIILLALIVSLNLLLNRACVAVQGQLFIGSDIFLNQALPLAFTAVFVTMLFRQKAGIIIGMLVAGLSAHLQGEADAYQVMLLGAISSLAAVYTIRNARTRLKTFRGAAAIAATIFLLSSLFLFLVLTPWPTYFKMLEVAALNGFLVLLLANILLPITEYLFKLTTDITLLELSDLNHPLLRRVQMEAPGTYHHTMMVATLSEHAAEAIGANSLLARVASYFHDIGKLSNPGYFTENSFDVDRHEDLSPNMSALIILNHVKEGLNLAQKYKLKPPLREVIETHHGTSLVGFFYQRAMELNTDGKERVDENDFRYPGPLPVGKEASIISVADACEAASRSLSEPTPGKIDTLVSDIITNRLLDGQLNDSDLSMSELQTVRESIKKSLRTMLHLRISYNPNLVTNENSPEQKIAPVPTEKSAPVVEGDSPSG